MKVDFNTDADHIDIPFSKYKVGGLLAIGLAFFILGLWFIINPETFVSTGHYYYRYRSKTEILIIGLLLVIFCGAASVFYLYKFFSSKPGLAITELGITDNSNLTSTGFIKWSDITQITSEAVGPAVYIMVHVKNPEVYIEEIRSSFKRKSALANYKKHGTPVIIAADALRCDFNDLYTFLSGTLSVYKKAAKN